MVCLLRRRVIGISVHVSPGFEMVIGTRTSFTLVLLNGIKKIKFLASVVQLAILQYFCDLFQTSRPQTINQVVGKMEPKITQEMNNLLLHPFSSAEIREALFQMHLTMALDPDGMNALFYQKIWHIIGHDVSEAILEFLHSGQMLKSINYTHIALIPKVKATL